MPTRYPPLIHLRALAVRENRSLRCIVLTALPSLGIHVKPEDIAADRRKLRPKGTRTNYARQAKVLTIADPVAEQED
jgi:hypothetical protein